jgi:hypothetical protein
MGNFKKSQCKVQNAKCKTVKTNVLLKIGLVSLHFAICILLFAF